MRRQWVSASKSYLHKAETPDEISFVKERIRLPSGREFNYVHVESPYEVVVIVVTRGDRVALIKQFRYLIQDEIIEIPAGSPAPGQTLEEGARQEALEETGVYLGPLSYLGVYYPSVGITNQKMHLFMGESTSQGDQSLDESEEIQVIWENKARIVEMISNNEIKNAGAALALSIAALKFRWGRNSY